MSSWWRREKPARRRRVDPDLDITLEGAEPSWEPPQAESLFDADEYVSDWSGRLTFEQVFGSEAGLDGELADAAGREGGRDESVTASDLGAADGTWAEPIAEHSQDAGPSEEPASWPWQAGAGFSDEDEDPAHGHHRHVRRRRFGRARKVAAAVAVEGDVSALTEAAVSEIPARSEHGSRDVFEGPWGRVLGVFLIVCVLLGSLYGLAVGVNAVARWNARRVAALNAAPASPAEDNLLVIGVTDGVAVGFTALKAERGSHRILGIAIPDGAFVEVPGQGFERVGVSYAGGPDVSKDTVSNYLGVPFRSYVVIDGASYQAMLKDQSVTGIMSHVTSTDLTAAHRASFTTYFASVNTKDVWIVPLPVKPVAVGDQRYFEPQRAQVADLLLQWWGVQASQQKATPRVIVYNGVGTPGIAGLAAQQLIRAGLRVVDSGNADNFKHATTLVLLYHGTQADAELVRKTLGVGQIVVQSSTQDLADMIVIIGADYRPPTADLSAVPTASVSPSEGVQ